MQIKELQARLDTGDGCKYISIDNVTKQNFIKVKLLRFSKNFVSTMIIQTAAVYTMYVIYKRFDLSRAMFKR